MLTVIVAALAVVPFVFNVFFDGRLNFNTNAAQYSISWTNGKASYTGDGYSTTDANQKIQLDGSAILTIAAGQNGSGGSDCGYGATCLGFASGIYGGNAYLGAYASSGYYQGGGYTEIRSDLAVPSGGTAGWGYAAGGGGGYTQAYTAGKWNIGTSDFTPTGWTDAYFSGCDPTSTGITYDYCGLPGGSSSHGSQGKLGSSARKANVRDGASRSVTAYGYVYKTFSSSGGGAGYKHGGGGGYHSTSYYSSSYNDNIIYKVFPGGGGCCSPNLYPIYAEDAALGIKSAGKGWLKAYKIAPTTVPYVSQSKNTENASVVDPGSSLGTDIWSIDAASKDCFGVKQSNGTITDSVKLGDYIGTDWAYRYKTTTDGKTWSTWSGWSLSAPTLTSAATQMDVECAYVIYAKGDTTQKNPCYNMKYKSATDAAAGSGYTVKTVSLSMTKKGTSVFTTKPAAPAKVVWNGSEQSLLGNTPVTTVGGSWGGVIYTVDSNGNLSATYTAFSGTPKATAPGRYYVAYHAWGNDFYVSSYWGGYYVTIEKADPEFSVNTLAPVSAAVYTGGDLKMFTGEGYINTGDTDAVLEYCVVHSYSQDKTDSPPTPTWGTNVNPYKNGGTNCSVIKTNVEDVLGTAAAGTDGTNCWRYLYYRYKNSTNYNQSNWVYTGKYMRIEKATLNITPTLMAECDYDGKSHTVITSVSYGPNSTKANIQNDFDITYTVSRSYAEGKQKFSDPYTDANYKNAAHVTAVDISVTVSWSPKSTVTAANYESGSSGPFTTKIKRISDTNKVTTSGLAVGSDLKLSVQGECTPFTKSAVDMTVCGNPGDNYITSYSTTDDVWDSNGITPINHLSYQLSQSGTAPSTGYKTVDSPAKLNEAILAATVNNVGKWYLYFNVERHYNLIPGTKIKAYEFTVGGMVINNNHLSGITMTGSTTNDPKNGAKTYNGGRFTVVTDTSATITSAYATFSGVEYALGTNSTSVPTDGWKSSLANIATVTECKTYYLFVRWDENGNVAENSGILYGTFKIVPYDANNTNTYFSGHDFKTTWGDPETSNSLQYYSQVFKNSDYQFGTISSVTAYVKGQSSIATKEFGTFYFALAKSQTEIPTNWQPLKNFNQLKMKNVGTYYLRIKWDGGSNVNGTTTGILYAYMIQGTSTICNPVFNITKLTNNTNVNLAHSNYAVSRGTATYQYVDNGGYATSVSQPVFEAGSEALKIKINDVAYDTLLPDPNNNNKTTWQVNYLVSEISEIDQIKANDPNWKSTLAQATITQTGTYYLWVKLVAQDANIDITRIYRFAGNTPTCVVQKAVSYVKYLPTIRTDLRYTGFPQSLLKADSIQTSPRVQFSTDNGENWIDDWEDVKATVEGTHIVLLRGYPVDSKNFEVQTSGYSQVQVSIKASTDDDVYYATYSEPNSTSGVVYTGQPIPTASLFNIGYARAGEVVDVPLLYQWEGDSSWVTYDKLPLKTNVGTYKCYYKPDSTDYPSLASAKTKNVVVQITKAEIQVGSLLVAEDDLVYKATDYELLLQAMDYGMVNAYGTLTNTNSVSLTYKNYLKYGAQLLTGNMGTLYYGLSKNSNVTPSEWVTDYKEIKARTVGNYYIWTKVDEGTNHKAAIPQCHNISKAIKIVPVDLNSSDYSYDNIYVNQSTYSVNKGSAGTGLRYNGLPQSLISSFTLGMIIADRNNEGEVLLHDGSGIATQETSSTEVKYNGYNPDDNIGTIWFAIVKQGASYPAEGDESDTGWSLNYETLSKVDAATYDLCFRLVPDKNGNSNIKSTIIYRISAMATWNGSVRDEIRIAPAVKSDLKLSGYFKEDKMFNGHPQTITQTQNGLKVEHETSYVNFTDEYNNQITEQKYCYVKKNELPPTLDSNWTDFENTKVLEVGEYQLYVKLITTSNIDCTTEPLIYSLLGENLAQITLVNESGITVVNPVYVNGLVYNGLDQNLISQAAYLKMTNGTVLVGRKGAITYYISSSSTEIDKNGTTKNGVAYPLNEVKELHAGTYYIWAQFAEGESHTAMGPFYVGSVSIAQATHENIELSNLEFNTETYNGEEHALIKTKVKQTFITGGKELNGVDDYAKIEYAYSNNPEGLEGGTVWYEEANLSEFVARNAGNYYVWLRVTGKINDVTNVKDVVDFIKCYSSEEYALIERATLTNDNIEGVLSHEGLVYIAQSQQLASIPNKLKLVLSSTGTDLNTEFYNKDLSINWGVSDSRETEPTVWYTTIDSIQGTDHDYYYLWIWIPECKNILEHKVCFDEIYIDKATLHFTQEPGIYTNLIYNGSYQNLLSSAPIIKYYAVGKHYDQEITYYDANGVFAEYRNTTSGSDWSSNLSDMQGLDAKTYRIHYRVPEADNWYSVEADIDVIISPADASTDFVGLVEAPRSYVDLAYNEKEQDLVFFGLMSDDLPVAGCGAALEGCQIVFYYADDEYQKQYKYYYDVASGEYVWDPITDKLPGRVNVGEYHIKYFVTESTKTDNFKASGVYDLYITIDRREVFWEVKPDSIYGLKFTSNEQRILVAGELNVGKTDPLCTAKGVTVLYTLDDPNAPVRNWQEDIPVVDIPDLWYVWYRVEVDENNVFIGTENNDPEMGEMIVVLIERHVLAIRDLPRSYETIQYTAEEQSLIEYYFLSTDDVSDLGENAPYFEYSFSKYASDEDWVRDIKAKDVGEYTVYYRLNYNDDLFEFRGENDGREEPMQITVVISPITLNVDSIRAVYIEDEDGGYLTYEAANYESFNHETQEWEYSPMYSDVLLNELEGNIQYFYRRGDQYTQDVGWLPWSEGTNIDDLGIGSYQFMLRIVGDNYANFEDYAQTGYKGFDTYTNKEDRVVEVIMQDYNTPAYVRAWIDFTTTMTYEESQFKFEGWVDKNGRLEIPFFDVDSTGRYNGAVIRLQTLNASYYYMSQDALSKENKSKIELKSSEVKNVIKSFNAGLIQDMITVYLYEVYRIQYDANGGIGDNLSEGWKWHKIDYLLAENKFSKTENGEVFVANGWNTSKAGNGTNYSSGAMYYREDASQIFYAKFFASGENYYTVKWIIDNGSKRYALSRDFNVWFDTSIEQYQSRDTGVLVAEGDLITLPQIQIDENGKSLSSIFGGYILGWYTEEENIPYSIGMTATRNVTFVAELNFDINDFVQCKFLDEENEEIHYSGLIANGAQAYMALSGMDANLIRDYNEGYKKWVAQYAFEYLDASGKPDGVLEFNLGTKEVIEDEPEKEVVTTWDDYISMFVILGIGVAAAIVSLSVYIIMRKKHKQVI